MRILLATVFVCALHTYCRGSDEETENMARAYPQQKHIPIHRNIRILNAQKFLRAVSNAKQKQNYKKRHYDKAVSSYTVFPSINLKGKKLPFFESPYFPTDDLFNQKPNRIFKKMLPDYELLQHARYKRSGNGAVAKLNAASKTTKRNAVKRKETKRVSNVNRKNLKTKRNARSKKSPARSQRKTQNDRNKHPGNSRNSRANVNKRNVKIKRLGNSKSKVTSKVVKVNNGGSGIKPASVKKSKTVSASRRLIAGKDALIEEYPYVVSIQKYYEHWCAGALINPRLVITTANCVWKSDQLSRMRVRAGSRYADRGGQVARIQELMRHTGWSIRHNPDNDVAILLLDRGIIFSNKVHGVDLPNRGMMPTFEDAWVTGWGSDRRDGMFQDRLTLQAYHARVMNHGRCNNITQRFGVYVTHNFFCMSQSGRRSPCTRDTGAPAVSDGVLWGLASWGLRKLCGTERFPAVFTYIGSESIMNFIENTTNIFMSDKRIYPFNDRIRDFRIKALVANQSAAG